MRPSRVSSTLSVALMLPTTTPLTMAFFTATFAFTTPVGSTMRVLAERQLTLDAATDGEVLVTRQLAADEDGWPHHRVVAARAGSSLRWPRVSAPSCPCRRCP